MAGSGPGHDDLRVMCKFPLTRLRLWLASSQSLRIPLPLQGERGRTASFLAPMIGRGWRFIAEPPYSAASDVTAPCAP